VRDIFHIGSPLPFRVLDGQEHLLLNAGQVIHDEEQFEELTERGACAERASVDAERKARAAIAAPPVVVQLSIFDRWERLLWEFDNLARGLVRRKLPGTDLPKFHAALRARVDRSEYRSIRHCCREASRAKVGQPRTGFTPVSPNGGRSGALRQRACD
jgi:hypothetical protein